MSSRLTSQVWQWIKHGATLQPGNAKLTTERFQSVLQEELAGLRREVGSPHDSAFNNMPCTHTCSNDPFSQSLWQGSLCFC